MKLNLNVPVTDSAPLDITLEENSRLFIVGPNGSGKSALIQHAVTSLGSQNVRRISAHRQTWLQSGAIDMTPQSRRQFGTQHTTIQARGDSRWADQNAQAQLSSVLFDLVAKDNEQARRIAAQGRAKNYSEIERIVDCEPGVFDEINNLIALAGLAIAIENSEGEELLARRIASKETYSIAQMSDGERNAVILAANVLTVNAGILLLIDEPERHLHRSIIEPFLTALFAQRPDCPFLVATHEINLPLANPEASVLMIRSCQWSSTNANTWDAKLIDSDANLPEDIKRAILGSRNRILFVEGKQESLDVSLYRALFPNTSVIPVGGCDDVVKTVDGLRNSEDHHDVQAFGLIDGDNRNPEDHPKLVERGIYPLNSYSVESLYYCMAALNAVAHRQAESLGKNADEMADIAKNAAIEALRQDGIAERMAARRSELKVRQATQSQMPDWKSIQNQESFTMTLRIGEWFAEELSRFKNLLADNDLENIIARYPVRESDVLDKITAALELKNTKAYQDTLLARVRTDSDLAARLRKYTGQLANELSRVKP